MEADGNQPATDAGEVGKSASAATAPEPAGAAVPESGAAPASLETALAAKPAVDLTGDKVPDWMKLFDATGADVELSDEELEKLPMPAKKALHVMYAQVQAQQAEAKKREDEQKSRTRKLEEERVSIQAERGQLYDIFKDERLQKFLKGPEGEAPDPLTDEGITFRAQQAASGMIKQFLDAMVTVSKDAEEKRQTEIRTVQRDARKVEVKAFVEAHSDFSDHREDIVKLVKEHGIRAEDAYYVVLGRKGLQPAGAAAKQPDATDDSRAQARKLSARGGARVPATKSAKDMPSGSLVEIAQQLQSNPELQERILQRMRRRVL